MTESRWLSRMPVYDIAKGRVVGRIHRLIVDADSRKVVGLLLATRLGREPRCLPFRHVHAIGEHAVTVKGTDAIAPISELPDMEEAYRSQRRIYNSPVLTESGSFIGDIEEYTINPQSGRLESMLVSGGLIKDLFRGPTALPAHLVVAIGEDATIVKDVAVTYLEQRHREQKQKGKSARTAAATAASAATVAAIRPIDIVGGMTVTDEEKRTDSRQQRATGREHVSWKERLRSALSRQKRSTSNVEPLRPVSSDEPNAPAGQRDNGFEPERDYELKSDDDRAQETAFERKNVSEREQRYAQASDYDVENEYELKNEYDQDNSHETNNTESENSSETKNTYEKDSSYERDNDEDTPPKDA